MRWLNIEYCGVDLEPRVAEANTTYDGRDLRPSLPEHILGPCSRVHGTNHRNADRIRDVKNPRLPRSLPGPMGRHHGEVRPCTCKGVERGDVKHLPAEDHRHGCRAGG